MDLVIEEEDLDKAIYIDVTRTNTLGKTHQKAIVSTGAVKVRQKAYNARKVDKYDDYHLVSQITIPCQQSQRFFDVLFPLSKVVFSLILVPFGMSLSIYSSLHCLSKHCKFTLLFFDVDEPQL